MGIPFSREINAAFEQVTPLVQAAYEVLETTKNIALILLAIQVMTIITLLLMLLALVGLLITMNPELERERKLLVTPVMKWIASWSMTASGHPMSVAGLIVGSFALAGFAFLFYVYWTRKVADATIENEAEARDKDENEALKKGKDVDAIKKGEAKQ